MVLVGSGYFSHDFCQKNACNRKKQCTLKVNGIIGREMYRLQPLLTYLTTVQNKIRTNHRIA